MLRECHNEATYQIVVTESKIKLSGWTDTFLLRGETIWTIKQL